MNMDDLIAFCSARLDEAERTIYREGSPPHGVIAWLTYCEPDGSMIYATVAHGDTDGGPWIAAGKELPEPASVLVVYDPVRSLRHVAAGRAVIKRYENAATAAARGSMSGFVHGQDDGYAEACLDAIRDEAAAWNDHPDYRAEWKAGGVMSEAGGGLTYPDSAGDETCDGTVVAYVIAASPSAPFPGWYLKNVGSVDAHWTPEPGEAMRFPSSAAAATFWNSVPPGLGAYFPVQVELVTE